MRSSTTRSAAARPTWARAAGRPWRRFAQSGPASPCEAHPGVDADLEAICLKALAHAPEDRYPTAEDLADDLERWLEGAQPHARLWSSRERLAAWRRRNPLLATASALALAFLTLAAVLVTLQVLELAREPAHIQLDLARHQADTVRIRLLQFASAADAAAGTPGLGAALAAGDLEEVQRLTVIAGARLNDLDGESPFESWWLVDRKGALVARWPHRLEAHEGWDFSRRDYVLGALACASAPTSRCLCQPRGDGACAYASKVLYGLTSRQYKLGIARAVLHEGVPVGVIVAGVLASQGLRLPQTEPSDSATGVIVRVDPTQVGDEPAEPPDWVLLFHPAFGLDDQPLAHPARWEGAPGLGVDERYRDPAADADPAFGGAWLAAFVPVEGTDVVVVAQRRRAPRSRLGIWTGVGASSFLLLLLVRGLRRRR
ncbi:MAG: hypothetical protein P1V51_00255 [Deltaproteobacteria bacterium]|nr:hypothetical protein [Deltaproteobacteria bacterium]